MATVGRRRVPPSQRQRAVASCDRCKKRRIRCERSENGVDSCKACSESGNRCQSTLPRKQRIYGSLESFSLRYRTFDAFVKGLFPEEDFEDLQTVRRLAAERGIDLPEIADTSVTNEAFDNLGPTVGPSHASKNISALKDSLHPEMHTTTVWPINVDSAVQGTVVNIQKETCIPAPHGEAHYIGPCSSFEFANAIRTLVAKVSNINVEGASQNRSSRVLSDFANLKVSIAMEPRIEEHPASTVREEGTEEGIQSTPLAHTSPTTVSSPPADKISSSLLRRWLQNLLPSREQCDKLIDGFFSLVHPNYLLFHRGTFQTQYESIWHRTAPYNYDVERGWFCCLFMVLGFGAQAIEPGGSENAAHLQRRFLRFVRQRFQHLSLTASLANVQALLLLQLYEHNAGERNTSWILLGQAARMAIALGMHREGTSHHFESIERNTRRKVWFTLYSFEQFVALTLGRPTTIKALEVNINLPDEALMDGNDYPPGYLKHYSKLMDLMSKIRHFATAASPNCFNLSLLESLLDSAVTLTKELRAWESDLPKHLLPNWQFFSTRHQRVVILMHITYHHISSVLTRPYLLYRVHDEIEAVEMSLSSEPNPNIESLGQECLGSSLIVTNLLRELSSNSILEGVVWIDFFYLYHAVLILSLEFLSPQRYTQINISNQNRQYHESVTQMIELCKIHKLSPTYHILSQVAIQFAHVVGMAGDSHIARSAIQNSNSGKAGFDDGPPQQNSDQNFAEFDSDEIFMPFIEPISDMRYYNSSDASWNFFNVGAFDASSVSFWPTMHN